jgi:hypothetical protein
VAKKVDKENVQYFDRHVSHDRTGGLSNRGSFASAAASTTYLGSWTFDSGPTCDPQGWTALDRTAQTGDYVHVTDFAGLAGGSFGRLFPLQGAQSLWIGAAPNASDLVLCGYASLPGYGNGWNQAFCSDCFTVGTDASLTFLTTWDSEPGYDGTTLEVDQCDGFFVETSATPSGGGHFDGLGVDSLHTEAIPDSLHSGSLSVRIHFQADGAWSDSDGLWDTDGGIIIDSLSVSSSLGLHSLETFEAESPGDHATASGDWQSCIPTGYGDFSGLLPGLLVVQQDPCFSELSCLWTFFNGSTANYACGGFPAQTAIPYGNAEGQYMYNQVVSPIMPFVGTGTTVELQFNVYRDLPSDPLIRYIWHVRSFVGGCPLGWESDGFVNRGSDTSVDWLPSVNPMGDKIAPGATDIQVAIGTIDMCPFWCGTVGSGNCHSNAPMFDNVEVIRVNTLGPSWDMRKIDTFNDNFATDGTVTGTVRIDVALDVLPTTNPGIIPGDSASASITDPAAGLATDAYTGTGPAAYMYVAIHPQNQAGKAGDAISDDPRFPVVDSTTSPNGTKWYIIRGDSVRLQQGQTTSPDNYCWDLNDNLFTPGDTIEYFVAAENGNGERSYFHGGLNHLDNADASGAVLTTSDLNTAFSNAMEVTCLPAAAINKGGDILYVDGADGRSSQPWFDQAFNQMGILDEVDRFDITGPSSWQGNGIGSRVQNVFQQILPYYKKIIWSSADLTSGTIGDGTGNPNKADDFAVLFTFIDQSNKAPALYINGEGVANDWFTMIGANALNLRSAYMTYNVLTADHKQLGYSVAPRVMGAAGSCFDHILGPDTLIAFGGCPGIEAFNVLQPTGTAVAEAYYENNTSHAAIVSQQTLNSAGFQASVMVSGYPFELIRDDRAGANGGVADYVHHLYDIITWLGNTPPVPTQGKTVAFDNDLSQNYPNPFNPTTTIEFALREQSKVTLRVYNVAGQLVRTLVDDVKAPGVVHTAIWDGRDNRGQSVSSGVYFYKLTSKNFVQTRKMVLLK